MAKKKKQLKKDKISTNETLHILKDVKDDELREIDKNANVIKLKDRVKLNDESKKVAFINSPGAVTVTNKVIDGCRFIISGVISFALLIIILNVISSLTLGVMTSVMYNNKVLSDDMLLATTVAMTTSFVWIMVLKVRLFERLHNVLKRIIPNISSKGKGK